MILIMNVKLIPKNKIKIVHQIREHKIWSGAWLRMRVRNTEF